MRATRTSSRPSAGRWLAALTVVLLSAAAIDCAAPQTPAADPMPTLVKGLRIGMSEKELLAVRPAAEKFVFLEEREADKNDPNPLYVESFSGSPFFDTGMYLFCQHKLCEVTLAAVGGGEGFADRQARVLQGALHKWGQSPQRLLNLGAGSLDPAAQMELERSKVEPRKRGALLWTLGRLRVVATFAPDEGKRERPAEIGVTLADPQLLPKDLRRIFFASLAPVRSASDTRLFALLERKAEPPLFD